jgi:hypothetical protein
VRRCEFVLLVPVRAGPMEVFRGTRDDAYRRPSNFRTHRRGAHPIRIRHPLMSKCCIASRPRVVKSAHNQNFCRSAVLIPVAVMRANRWSELWLRPTDDTCWAASHAGNIRQAWVADALEGDQLS